MMDVIDPQIIDQYQAALEADAHWLTEYAQDKKDCERIIEVTITMYRSAWALRTILKEKMEVEHADL